MKINPFNDLYLAENTSPEEYVELFSPFLVEHVLQLFNPGNIVVIGTQGMGKSMLLGLLKSETRLMYDKVGNNFPVPPGLRKFISANINLNISNATTFGSRDWSGYEKGEIEMLFGDLLNSILVLNLIKSIENYYANSNPKILKEVGLANRSIAEIDLSQEISNCNFWKGYLVGAKTLQHIKTKLEIRVNEFEDYLQFRTSKIPQSIITTKTLLGEPIEDFAGILKRQEILDHDTNIFVDIDQYEELHNITSIYRSTEPIDYRSVINKALAKRSAKVSYRIGSRKHSWSKHSNIMGSKGHLEEERDFKFINLDALLGRKENTRTHIFPKFAEDVFRRRIKNLKFNVDDKDISLKSVYGGSLTPEKKAVYYSPNNPTTSMKLEEKWKEVTKDRLITLAKKNPLSACLGEAWIRQKGESDNLDVRDGSLPWEQKVYWKKERVEHALLQLASRNQQRVIYSGAKEIAELSGGNILTFISLNHHIWGQYRRYEQLSRSTDSAGRLPSIGIDLQSNGIFEASEHWFKKMSEETGRSEDRKRFVRELSRYLREKMMGDKKLSYPGACGISVKDTDLDEIPNLKRFLEELSDYRNLLQSFHTTKSNDRAPRHKWHINPILCPYFRLPYKRTKEPIYITGKIVLQCVVAAKIQLNKLDQKQDPVKQVSQRSFFEGD